MDDPEEGLRAPPLNPDQEDIDNWIEDTKQYRTMQVKEGIRATPIQGINMYGPKDQTQSLLDPNAQNTRSNEMASAVTPSEMLKCLEGHGCPDLRLFVDPDSYSSCRAAEGSFGDVWKARLTDRTDIAVKVLRYALVCKDGKKSMKRAFREIYNWSKLEHKNIHKLLGVTMHEGRVGMVSNWMENGTLQQYLKQRSDINYYPLCIGVAEGVAYLHSVNMVHGDLKACNILVSLDGVPKLTDFDHSILSDSSLVFSATTRIGGGTLRWMAPELLIGEASESQEKNKHTDVYALGMTLLEVVTSSLPYSECRRDHNVLIKLNRKELPKRSMVHFPENEQWNRMWCLLTQCWDHDPMSRPTADDVIVSLSDLTHPELKSPPLTDINTFPSDAAYASTFTETNLPSIPALFGLSPSSEVIDRWVDHAVDTDQIARQGACLKCPEPRCQHIARLPHALKIHLYTHYGLKREYRFSTV
ncbi:unnamed protein product [Rhizoctonia solani]|uniref:Protein kinase domain-containing protein n=1 Tax=Rhizoctonia solani TaxID=456999 RepID=A0A8H3GP26_9AGAM|nr:unnamed protein product [Rhizoctonia solani]